MERISESQRRDYEVRGQPSVEILSTRGFKMAFLASLSRPVSGLSVVSPFITPIPGFKTTHNFFRNFVNRHPDASVVLVTRPPNDARQEVLSWQEAQLIEALGVNVRIWSSPPLHSKVYYFKYAEGDYSSFVGSANFTKGGFESNVETTAHWRGVDRHDPVERELARLANYGSVNLLQWKVKTQGKDATIEVEDVD